MSISKRLAIVLVVMGTLITTLALTRAADKDPVVTYEDVLKLLKDKKVKPETIIQKVEESSTKFTLGADQLAELRKAGASEKLIQAMQKKGAVVAAGSDIGAFVIILDCSGSMKDPVDPKDPTKNKWDAAQKAAIDLVDSVPVGREVAFIAYGSDTTLKTKETTCKDVLVLRPLSALDAADKASLKTTIQALKPYGGTPIALSLEKAGKELAKAKSLAMLVLITDGIESCDGDPARAAEELVKTHKHLQGGVDVIGFGLKKEESDAVAKIAEAGQGKFHDATNLDALSKALEEIKPRIENVQPDPRGEPTGMAKGQPRRWYVWHDKEGWHVRTTTKGITHHFEGKIQVIGGQITSIDVAKLQGKGAAKDWWNLSDGQKVLSLDLKTTGGMDGFDFQVGEKATLIKFTLTIDKKDSPAQVFIGKKGTNPPLATFTLPAHPGKK